MSDMSVMRDSSMNLCKILKKLGGEGCVCLFFICFLVLR